MGNRGDSVVAVSSQAAGGAGRNKADLSPDRYGNLCSLRQRKCLGVSQALVLALPLI